MLESSEFGNNDRALLSTFPEKNGPIRSFFGNVREQLVHFCANFFSEITLLRVTTYNHGQETAMEYENTKWADFRLRKQNVVAENCI